MISPGYVEYDRLTQPRVCAIMRLISESGRSTIALAGAHFEVASAGTEATCVHPLAIRAMEEVGIDLRGRTSKTIDAFLGERWDDVITVCNNANKRCPLFPGETTRIHWSFDDPSQAISTDEDKLKKFRRVRDEILTRLRQWLADHGNPTTE